MSNFTCTSKKENFKNLTVDKEYIGTDLDNGTIEIINDAGVNARYAKRYFNNYTSTRERTRPTPVIRNISIGEYVNENVTIEIGDFDEGLRALTMAINNNSITRVYFSDTLISCGVKQIEGLENIIANIDNIKRAISSDTAAKHLNITTFSDSELFLAIIKRILYIVKRSFPSAFVIFSTVKPDRSILADFNGFMIDSNIQGCMSGMVTNPNSTNEIAVWVVDITVDEI